MQIIGNRYDHFASSRVDPVFSETGKKRLKTARWPNETECILSYRSPLQESHGFGPLEEPREAREAPPMYSSSSHHLLSYRVQLATIGVLASVSFGVFLVQSSKKPSYQAVSPIMCRLCFDFDNISQTALVWPFLLKPAFPASMIPPAPPLQSEETDWKNAFDTFSVRLILCRLVAMWSGRHDIATAVLDIAASIAVGALAFSD